MLPRALYACVGTCSYRIEKDDVVVSSLFELLDPVQHEIGIVDWGIKMTTLEDGNDACINNLALCLPPLSLSLSHASIPEYSQTSYRHTHQVGNLQMPSMATLSTSTVGSKRGMYMHYYFKIKINETKILFIYLLCTAFFIIFMSLKNF